MQVSHFHSDGCEGTVFYSHAGLELEISGTLKNPKTGKPKCGYTFRYVAANPPDTRYSRAGSGLPFPNPDIAFDNTPSEGEVTTNRDGSFQFRLKTPNSYYLKGGRELVPPTVYIIDEDTENLYSIPLEEHRIKNRSLTNLHGRPRRSHGR